MQYLYHLIVHWGSGGHNVNICIYKSTNYIMQTSGNNGRRKGHSHQTHLSVFWLVHNLSEAWIHVLDIYTPQFLCRGRLLTSDSQCTGFETFLGNHGENFHFIQYHLNVIVICLKLKANIYVHAIDCCRSSKSASHHEQMLWQKCKTITVFNKYIYTVSFLDKYYLGLCELWGKYIIINSWLCSFI